MAKKKSDGFNLQNLFNRAFPSQIATPYPGSTSEKLRVEILTGYKSQTFNDPVAQRYSILGTPIWMPCTLDGYELPNEPLITIERSKTIVRTELIGYDGSVKENMGHNDYEIIIQGVAVNESSDSYPEDIIRKFRELEEKKTDISVVSPLLSLFGITRLVIERLRLPAVEGQMQSTGYEFQCLSDIDISLIIRDAVL